MLKRLTALRQFETGRTCLMVLKREMNYRALWNG